MDETDCGWGGAFECKVRDGFGGGRGEFKGMTREESGGGDGGDGGDGGGGSSGSSSGSPSRSA